MVNLVSFAKANPTPVSPEGRSGCDLGCCQLSLGSFGARLPIARVGPVLLNMGFTPPLLEFVRSLRMGFTPLFRAIEHPLVVARTAYPFSGLRAISLWVSSNGFSVFHPTIHAGNGQPSVAGALGAEGVIRQFAATVMALPHALIIPEPTNNYHGIKGFQGYTVIR